MDLPYTSFLDIEFEDGTSRFKIKGNLVGTLVSGTHIDIGDYSYFGPTAEPTANPTTASPTATPTAATDSRR